MRDATDSPSVATDGTPAWTRPTGAGKSHFMIGSLIAHLHAAHMPPEPGVIEMPALSKVAPMGDGGNRRARRAAAVARERAHRLDRAVGG